MQLIILSSDKLGWATLSGVIWMSCHYLGIQDVSYLRSLPNQTRSPFSGGSISLALKCCLYSVFCSHYQCNWLNCSRIWILLLQFLSPSMHSMMIHANQENPFQRYRAQNRFRFSSSQKYEGPVCLILERRAEETLFLWYGRKVILNASFAKVNRFWQI